MVLHRTDVRAHRVHEFLAAKMSCDIRGELRLDAVANVRCEIGPDGVSTAEVLQLADLNRIVAGQRFQLVEPLRKDCLSALEGLEECQISGNTITAHSGFHIHREFLHARDLS